ncbi:MAG: p-hydroxycinnamoyl-CoA synthetase [Pseudonocardia sp.]|jgi:fatty-acyl-CoA synthase|uniref:acyl-CoA synthetase n=1 Tax=Pseudonocardia sp. TaxID=60912 RepID=UPI0026083891|nr:long-chain fatty acid--CoA ligase [Pseudonocardia sp.]MCU1631044.1 p-hydroxycinnamoyl-CoA synthetase [Pseudonocardia sp.]
MNNQGIGTWIHRRRVKSAGRVALVHGGVGIAYEQLAERIDRLANGLAQRGIGEGDRVAYLGENHPSFLETLFAAGLLGAVFVPLNTRLAPPEIRHALSDSGARILVHGPELTDAATVGSAGTSVTHRLVTSDDDPPTGDVGGPVVVVESLDAVVAASAADHRDVPVGLTDPAMILYTSGTTGRPKGALLTHGNVTWNCMNVLVDYDVTGDTVALMISPMFHVASLTMGVLPTLLKGGTVVLEARFDPAQVLKLIEQHRVTSMSGVPTTYQMLSEHPAWASTDLGSLRTLTCGGSAVPLRVIDAYEERGLAFTGGYGMTETAPGATSLQPRYSRAKAGSAGLPHFFTDVRIVDANGEIAPAGRAGEIQIQGPNVIPGYWQRPDATAESFADGTWFRSGDIGHVDDDGFLHISDRLKDMIIAGGENVYPAEIEQIIMELDAVSGVAVVGVPDRRWGEVPHAFIQLKDGRTLAEGAIQQHLDGRLARYKIPRTVVVVDELPRTPTGKIRKQDLRKTPETPQA